MAIPSSSRDISLLSPAQIRAMLPEDVAQIPAWLFQYFSQTQLQAFTPTQLLVTTRGSPKILIAEKMVF